MNTKSGFTLIESMIALSVSSLVAVGGVTYLLSEAEAAKMDSVTSKIVKLVSAVDQRVYIDKYDITLWPAVQSYVTTNQVNDFLKREFIAKTASCGDSTSGWSPVIDDPSDVSEVTYKESLKLVPCTVWSSTNAEFGLEVSSKFNGTATELRNVNFYFKFKDDKEFQDNFLNFKRILKKTKEQDGKNITGSHNYYFVDVTKTNPEDHSLTSMECLALKSGCGILAQYSADGSGVEYLDVTGGNSMINSKIDFTETEGGAVINTCFTFEYKSATNTWEKRDKVDCGLGIDSTKTNPFVEADIYSVNSEKVFLNKLCDMAVGASIVEVPCGMFNNDAVLSGGTSKAIAVLDELQSKEAFVNLLTVKEITTDNLNIDGTLNVDGSTNLNKLNVTDASVFNETVTMNGIENEVNQDLTIFGETEVDILTVNSVALFKKNLQIDGYLDISNGYIKADHLELGSITQGEINRNCLTGNIKEGALKLYTNASRTHTEPVICTRFRDIDGNLKVAWKLANARIGQIVPFDGTCPAGFDYFEDAAGRFLMGQNKTLLDGKTTAQKNKLVADGKAFTDKNGNIISIAAGDKGGAAYHALTEDEMPIHHHTVPDIKASCSGTDCAGFAMATVGARGDTVWSNANEIPTGAAGKGEKHENTPPYYAVNYCMYSGK